MKRFDLDSTIQIFLSSHHQYFSGKSRIGRATPATGVARSHLRPEYLTKKIHAAQPLSVADTGHKWLGRYAGGVYAAGLGEWPCFMCNGFESFPAAPKLANR